MSNLDILAGKEINYITNLEERITSLKLLKDKEIIDKATYKNQLGLDRPFYTG